MLAALALAPGADGAPLQGDATDPDGWVERTVPRMGTLLRVRVRAEPRDRALELLEAALREVGEVERLVSSWDPGSALSRLNRAPAGEWTELPRRLVDLLAEARALRDRTAGGFDPAVGALVDAWDLRGGGRVPGDRELERALATVRSGREIDPAGSRGRRMDPGVWVDAGGFGKGAALRAAARVLAQGRAEEALLDFGGQIVVVPPASGAPDPGRGGHAVHVAHPGERARPVARLRLAEGSVSTSGLSERGAHILDPRTGRPAPARGSVTVVGPDPVAVDALSTGLFVLGPDEGLARAAAWKDVGVLFLVLTRDGLEARANRTMHRWLECVDPEIRISSPSSTTSRIRKEIDTCDA